MATAPCHHAPARRHRPDRELAVRVSLGAGISRIRRQLFTEAVVLALCGGVPGFLFAVWGTRALVALAPEGIPRLSDVAVDPRILGFSVLITPATGFVFCLAPVVGLSGSSASLTLRERRRRTSPERLRDMVVVAEMALSLLLIIGAGLMLRTFRVLTTTDAGFNPSGLLVAHVSLPTSAYEEDSDRADGPGVVVINEAMARRYWPDDDPLGKRITFRGDPDDPDTEWSTIVGVVGNSVKAGLDTPPEPEGGAGASRALRVRWEGGAGGRPVGA